MCTHPFRVRVLSPLLPAGTLCRKLVGPARLLTPQVSPEEFLRRDPTRCRAGCSCNFTWMTLRHATWILIPTITPLVMIVVVLSKLEVRVFASLRIA